MKYLPNVSIMMLLMVSSSVSAWWDTDYGRNRGDAEWRNDSNYQGRHDGGGNTSRDGSLQGNVEFNVKLRGDADTYIYGNLHNDSENIYFDRYYNNYDGSSYGGVYRNQRQPDHAPYYRPGYSRPYTGW